MDDLLNIPGWRQSGLTVLVQVPKAIVFVYAYLYGATCLNTGQVRHAIELAQMRLALPLHDDEHPRPLWKCREIVGWPKSLSGNCKKAFDYVLHLPAREDWLCRIFVQPDDYAACVLGFNLLLSVTELTELLGKEGGAQALKSSSQLIYDVPPMFAFGETDLIRHAFRMAFHDGSAVDSLGNDFNVPSSLIREYWPLWVERVEGMASEWPPRFHGRVPTELP
jgi:hypothetical protein